MCTHVATRIAALAVALAATGCVINVDADQVLVRDEKRFAVGAGAELTLETFDGSIKVESWDRPEVVVGIEKRGPDQETAAALEVKSTQDGNRIQVEAPSPRVSREFLGIGNFSAPSVAFVVSVPRSIKLTARTRDGSIRVAGVNGVVDLRSGDGSIQGDGLSGDLTARTDDGSVRVVDVNGRVSLESGDGSIHAEGRMDALHARTGDGSIVIEAGDGSAMEADWDISTGDGSIVVRLPEAFNADIDATSRDGAVRADLAGLERTRDESGRQSMRGRLGSGGHVVKLRSGEGSINVVHR